MLKFFRHIRKKLIEEDNIRKPASPAGRYLLYAIGEILLAVNKTTYSVRDYLWVEKVGSRTPAGQAGLQHAEICFLNNIYRYVFPTGQQIWVKLLNHQNP